MKESSGSGGRVRFCFRFFTARGCLISLQVAVLVLAVQAMMQYTGVALSPRKWAQGVHGSGPGGGGRGGDGVRGGGRGPFGSRRGRALGGGGGGDDPDAPVVNTIFTPVCSSAVEDQYKGQPHPIADIAIASECSSRSRRDAIRAGWGSFAKTLDIRWRFFIGLPRGEDLHCHTSLSAEMRRFSDIVILPLMDTYENLTMKVMGMITYTAKCGEGDFYAKADDDVFVYPWRLKQRLLLLQNDSSVLERSMGAYMGNFWVDAKPIKEEWHKNYEGRWTGGYFPPYAGGPFYVLSRPAAEFVLINSKRLNWRWRNEDMAVGTWMTGADVKIVQEWKVKLLNWKHHERPFIAEHAIDTPDGVEKWHADLHANFSFVGA